MAAKGDLKVDEEFSEFLTKLWMSDSNACTVGNEFDVDFQGFVTSGREVGDDWASKQFFTHFDEETVFSRPTYQTFRALLDNYESETGQAETVTEKEREENHAFLDACMETEVIKQTLAWLAENGHTSDDPEEFKERLYTIWFSLYRRSREYRTRDSSGFEHVFVGETRGKDVIGLHNWIQIYLQEKRGNINYHGYFRRGTDKAGAQLVTLQFSFKEDSGKPLCSSFLGTSPEFELAMYTAALLSDRVPATKVNIDYHEVVLNVHPLAKGIGSAYPVS